mgnify:CR=1 FL=1
MRIARCITALVVCAMAIGAMQAQESASNEKTHIIEAFLDNTPAIYGSNLNFNDFFSDSYVTAKVYADDDSIVTKIKIKKCWTLPSGNSDRYSLKTAKKLLKESSKGVIRSLKWKPGKSECGIIWKPRHNHIIEKREADAGLISFITGLITDETKIMLYRYDCSTFISLRVDSTGTVLDTDHVGNIFWGTKGNGSTQHSMMFKPRFQAPRYMSEWEQGLYKANKQLGNNVQQIAGELNGRQFSGLAGGKKDICIEINIDTSDIEIEESDPAYPGGTTALKEYYTENFRYNKVLRRNKIKGIVNVNLLIGKDGKAKLMHIEMHEPTFAFEGMEPWYRIEKYVWDEIKRITKEMPRWNPGKYNGKEIDTECSSF